jgi:hypothetical protein
MEVTMIFERFTLGVLFVMALLVVAESPLVKNALAAASDANLAPLCAYGEATGHY